MTLESNEHIYKSESSGSVKLSGSDELVSAN